MYPADWSGDWGAEPLVSVTFTDAFKITAKSHEGQRSDGSYGGNVSEYTEGEPINFRFTLTGDPGTSGQLQIRYSENDGTCTFFDQDFNLGTHDGSAEPIVRVSGGTPTVEVASDPIAVSGNGSSRWTSSSGWQARPSSTTT